MKDTMEFFINGFTYALAFIQNNEVFQIIELVLSIITTLILLGFKIYTWWKKAKADGKIDKEEIDELVDIVNKDKKGE